MQEKKEALRLIEETLKELESPQKGSVLTAIQKLSRVALILDNQDIYIWCQIQLGDTQYTQSLKKFISIMEQIHKDNSQEEQDKLNKEYKNKVKVLSNLDLKQKIHYSIEELNVKHDNHGGGYKNIGFIEETYNDLIRMKQGNSGGYYKSHLNTRSCPPN